MKTIAGLIAVAAVVARASWKPALGLVSPDWSLADSTCTLTCHGVTHDLRDY